MNICVYGSVSDKLEPSYYEKALTLGNELGALGHNLVFGGEARGLMGYITEGSYQKHCHIIAVIHDIYILQKTILTKTVLK